jgi:hypothetical protein
MFINATKKKRGRRKIWIKGKKEENRDNRKENYEKGEIYPSRYKYRYMKKIK